MTAPIYLSHPSSLEHDTGAHPERAARIVAIERELAERGWLGFERAPSSPVDISLLDAVHTPEYVRAIERACAGGGSLDADTVVGPGSWPAALHAAGGAVQLVDLLLGGACASAISAHRPPGHHAAKQQAMGFCLFNNVAVAAQHALDAHRLRRVLVLDWDVHHGNGTNDIFHATSAVLYASIHEAPLYPGTGAFADRGVGEGEGYTVNLPVVAGSGDALFASLVEHVIVPLALDYGPQLVLVSAGYDAHAEDPLADCLVTDGGYAMMTGSMRRLAEQLGVPLGVVLEGGYALGALGRSVAATMEVLAAPGPPCDPGLEVHPAAAGALARLSERRAAAAG